MREINDISSEYKKMSKELSGKEVVNICGRYVWVIKRVECYESVWLNVKESYMVWLVCDCV